MTSKATFATADEYRALLADRKPKNAPSGALGRLPPSRMNNLESRYATHLELRKMAGEVLWWGFEVIKLRLADRTTYEPDFLVMLADRSLEVHETKGFMREDAALRLKLSAALFPFRFLVIREIKGGGWSGRDVDDGL